jgi:hypothetical protein
MDRALRIVCLYRRWLYRKRTQNKLLKKYFFFLSCFLWNRSPFLYIFSSAAPQRTAYSEMPSQIASHLRTAVHCRLGRLLDLNPGLQFYNLVSLPMSTTAPIMSHHCSHNEPPLLPWNIFVLKLFHPAHLFQITPRTYLFTINTWMTRAPLLLFTPSPCIYCSFPCPASLVYTIVLLLCYRHEGSGPDDLPRGLEEEQEERL